MLGGPVKQLARLVALFAAAACLAPAARAAVAQQSDSALVLMGYVTDQFGQPVAGAGIVAPGLRGPVSAAATAEGLYRIEGVAASATAVRIRRLGYLPATVVVRGRGETNLSEDVELQKLPDPLPPERVQTAEGELRATLDGFEERRTGGVGAFVDRRTIEKRRPATVTDIVRGMDGFRVVSGESGGFKLVSTPRDGGAACPARISVEGTTYTPVDGLDDFSPDQIEAVEAYAPTVSAPAPLDGAAGGCGLVVLWLRRQ
jgi:hypothetical protein